MPPAAAIFRLLDRLTSVETIRLVDVGCHKAHFLDAVTCGKRVSRGEVRSLEDDVARLEAVGFRVLAVEDHAAVASPEADVVFVNERVLAGLADRALGAPAPAPVPLAPGLPGRG